MKKLIALILVAGMILSLAACGSSGSAGGDTQQASSAAASAAKSEAKSEAQSEAKSEAAPAAAEEPAEKIVVKLAMTDPADSTTYQLAEEFIAGVNEDCGDAFDFQIYPSDQLGSYDVVSAEIIRGTVEMGFIGVDAGLDERVTLAYSSYLTSSYEDAKTVFAKDSFMYNFMKDVCAELGVTFLGFAVSDFSGMCLTKKCPEDPYLEGSGMSLQMRCPPSNQNRALIEMMGYIPASVDWSEVYSSAQTGVIDGFLGAGAYIAYTQFGDVIHYYVPINNICNANPIQVSTKFWETLTPEQQASFEKRAAAVFEKSLDLAQEMETEYLTKLEESGVEVIYPKEGELEALAKRAREVSWPYLKDFLGEETFNEMMSYYNVSI